MTTSNIFKVNMTREQKDIIVDASEVVRDLLDVLKKRREEDDFNGVDEIVLYDGFWELSQLCLCVCDIVNQ